MGAMPEIRRLARLLADAKLDLSLAATDASGLGPESAALRRQIAPMLLAAASKMEEAVRLLDETGWRELSATATSAHLLDKLAEREATIARLRREPSPPRYAPLPDDEPTDDDLAWMASHAAAVDTLDGAISDAAAIRAAHAATDDTDPTDPGLADPMLALVDFTAAEGGAL